MRNRRGNDSRGGWIVHGRTSSINHGMIVLHATTPPYQIHYLHGFGISWDGAPDEFDSLAALVYLQRRTDAGSGGTEVTVHPLDEDWPVPDNGASNQIRAYRGYWNTSPPTASSDGWQMRFEFPYANPSPAIFEFPEGMRPALASNQYGNEGLYLYSSQSGLGNPTYVMWGGPQP